MLHDWLLAGRDPAEAFRSGELIDDLKKAVAERALDAEMDVHLGGEQEQATGNHRNGHNRKRVLTESGAMDLEAARADLSGATGAVHGRRGGHRGESVMAKSALYWPGVRGSGLRSCRRAEGGGGPAAGVGALWFCSS